MEFQIINKEKPVLALTQEQIDKVSYIKQTCSAQEVEAMGDLIYLFAGVEKFPPTSL